MERHDFHVENLNVCPTSSDASIFTNDVPIKLSKQLAGLPKPLAVLIPSDHMSSLIFEACDLADLAVPEQVAILGINNSILDCDCAPVPLSSVDANLQTLGYEAARLLADLLDGQPAPKQPILIPPLSIVTRMSTSIAAVPHIHVASALQFIWQNHHRPIDVEDVVAHVPMSRIGLYRAFKRHLGRSIADEIARQRIEHAQQLLTSTHKKIYEIATLCGFENPDTFGRTFIRITGQSARQYRIRQDQQRSAKT
jgi:LacI family transcriptional regulator